MKDRRQRKTGRKTLPPFARFPHWIFESEQYAALSPRAVKLLLDLNVQYRGSNNGRLVVCDKAMLPRGWTSKDQRDKARDELLERGWIILTRQGGRNKADWFALTFWEIDASPLYDAGIQSSTTPLHAWKQTAQKPVSRKPGPNNTVRKNKSLTRNTGQLDPQHGSIKQRSHIQLSRSTGQCGHTSIEPLTRSTGTL